jgi:hypothetical protein
MQSTAETIATYTSRGAGDPTPLERKVPTFFVKWAERAKRDTDAKNQTQPTVETLPSGADRLSHALKPFFQYLNSLIEQEVYG